MVDIKENVEDKLARDLPQRGQHLEACDPENVRDQGYGSRWEAQCVAWILQKAGGSWVDCETAEGA